MIYDRFRFQTSIPTNPFMVTVRDLSKVFEVGDPVDPEDFIFQIKGFNQSYIEVPSSEISYPSAIPSDKKVLFEYKSFRKIVQL